ncbi:hypothetical protein GUJ93_ZPchr0004g39163 [Zizania palustris]|uniref:Uncharacterized protein n=1 Tax=Zizania palustris TaxID=103762 RepID=A0A8J5S0E6_ZIZPA|nr:hypothetical protein GUJ93_ZPchr0004g39163 [Zizania palustris]
MTRLKATNEVPNNKTGRLDGNSFNRVNNTALSGSSLAITTATTPQPCSITPRTDTSSSLGKTKNLHPAIVATKATSAGRSPVAVLRPVQRRAAQASVAKTMPDRSGERGRGQGDNKARVGWRH